MKIEKLPEELVLNIKEYLFVKCDECNKENIIHDVECNVTTTYYNNVFNDDFPFPRLYKSFDYVCKKCLKDLNEKLIRPLKY